MSYAYLFKYIIIGDTGNICISFSFFSQFNSFLYFYHNDKQVLANPAFSFNLRTKDFNQSTISRLVNTFAS